MKKLYFKISQVLFLLSLTVFAAFGNTTSLDASFNGTGFRLQAVGVSESAGYAIAVQPDGKIVVAGVAMIGTAEDDEKFVVARFNADGTPDTSFGTGGSAFSPLRHISAQIKLLIQPDGKILVSGTTLLIQQQLTAYAVTRFTSDGALDTTFNGTGYATANVPTSSSDTCHAMTLQADGKIVLVGKTLTFSGQSSDWDVSVLRFNSNGSLDPTFDGDGILKIGTLADDEEAYSVLVQPTGKILIGGRSTGTVERFMLTRINADGSTDTSFGTGGWNIFQLDFTNNNFTSMAQQSDGKVLASGGGKILRFSADGVRDMSFAVNGVQNATGTIEQAEIRVITGDKFVIGTRYGAYRYMANGAVDTNFGRNFTVANNLCYMRSVAVQSDGKVVLGGTCDDNTDHINRFAVARFQESPAKRYLDFNGDSYTDLALFRPSNGQWWYQPAYSFQTTATVAQFGTGTDRPVAADFTGDGKADIAVFRPSTGEWFVLRSDNSSYYSFSFGTTGDIPFADDFDGDQIADAGVFRPSTNQWYILKSTGGAIITTFGTAGDKPVPSDYDGDFKTDIAIYRPSNGQWWIQRSSDGSVYAFTFGTATDKPVPGDYDGDNKTDAAFWRPSTGEWFILRSDNGTYFTVNFGTNGDIPLPGNYGGDGKYDFVIFRPSTNEWHFLISGGAYFRIFFGAAGDQPVSNVFVP